MQTYFGPLMLVAALAVVVAIVAVLIVSALEASAGRSWYGWLYDK